MKKLTVFFALLILMIMLSGCFILPETDDPIIVLDPDIICEDGHYSIHWYTWSMTGCPGDELQEGVYWKNADDRLFYIGPPVEFDPNGGTLQNIVDEYGPCPKTYIEEILL